MAKSALSQTAGDRPSQGIHSMVRLNDDAAAVPDLLGLEKLIDQALNQAQAA